MPDSWEAFGYKRRGEIVIKTKDGEQFLDAVLYYSLSCRSVITFPKSWHNTVGSVSCISAYAAHRCVELLDELKVSCEGLVVQQEQ